MTIHNQPTDTAFARSPMLYEIEESTPAAEFVIADVYIWTGAQALRPAQYSYRLRKSLPASNRVTFDVSSFVTSLISQQTVGVFEGEQDKLASEECVWVQVEFRYLDNADAISSIQATSSFVIASNGYGEYLEGANQQWSVFMTSVKNHRISNAQRSIFAVNNSNATDISLIRVTFDAGGSTDFPLDGTTPKTTSSSNLRFFDLSPDQLGIVGTGYTIQAINSVNAVVDSIRIDIVEECRYDVTTMYYTNRYGVWDFVPFNKKHMESVKAKTFEYLKALGGVSYSTNTGQRTRYNGQTTKSHTFNTTFLHESIAEAIEQMMIANETYAYELEIPLVPTTENFNVLSSTNDKLIQYTMNFDEAFYTQNMIR